MSQSPEGALYWTDPDDTAHEWCKVLILLDGRFLGDFQIDPGRLPSTGYRRQGTAFFCPVCARIWGLWVVQNHRGEQQTFEVERVSCEKHYDQWRIPGSLLPARGSDELLSNLPPAVLRREFILHHERYRED